MSSHAWSCGCRGRSRGPRRAPASASPSPARAGRRRRSSPAGSSASRRAGASARAGGSDPTAPAVRRRRAAGPRHRRASTATSTGSPAAADCSTRSARPRATCATLGGAGASRVSLSGVNRGSPAPMKRSPLDLHGLAVEHDRVRLGRDGGLGDDRVVVAAHPDVGHAEGRDRVDERVLRRGAVVADVTGVDDHVDVELVGDRAGSPPTRSGSGGCRRRRARGSSTDPVGTPARST